MNYKKKKKALSFSLEAIIGLILSVIALLLLLQIFFNVFLNTPTNLQIAKDNAKSIVDFVNYYTDITEDYYYSTATGCYGVLKTEQLENFQIRDDDQGNYFYVVDSKGVYIIKRSDYEIFRNSGNPEEFSVVNGDEYEFKNSIDLKFDATEEGWGTSVDISDPTGFFTLATLGGYDNNIKLEDFYENRNQIVLMQSESWVNSNFKNENVLVPYVYTEEIRVTGTREFDEYDASTYQPMAGKSLIIKKQPGNSILFAPNSDLSSRISKANLCSRKYLNQKNLVSDVTNNYDSDFFNYFNYRFKMVCRDTGDFDRIFFETKWDGSKGVCLNGCQESFQINENEEISRDYNKFIQNMIDKCDSSNGNVELLIKDVERLDPSEIDVEVIEFNHAFERLNVDFNVRDMSPEEKEEKGVYNLLEREVNECDERYCKNVALRDKKAYFYIDEENNIPQYYKFSEDLLTKKRNYQQGGKYDFYFLGDKVESELIEIDPAKHTLWEYFSDDNKNIYKLKLNKIKNKDGSYDEDKYYDIILIPLQFYNIDEVDPDYYDFSDIFGLIRENIDLESIEEVKEGVYMEDSGYLLYVFNDKKYYLKAEDVISFSDSSIAKSGDEYYVSINDVDIEVEKEEDRDDENDILRLDFTFLDHNEDFEEHTVYMSKAQFLYDLGFYIFDGDFNQYLEKYDSNCNEEESCIYKFKDIEDDSYTNAFKDNLENFKKRFDIDLMNGNYDIKYKGLPLDDDVFGGKKGRDFYFEMAVISIYGEIEIKRISLKGVNEIYINR